jgi:hypothetical protein
LLSVRFRPFLTDNPRRSDISPELNYIRTPSLRARKHCSRTRYLPTAPGLRFYTRIRSTRVFSFLVHDASCRTGPCTCAAVQQTRRSCSIEHRTIHVDLSSSTAVYAYFFDYRYTNTSEYAVQDLYYRYTCFSVMVWGEWVRGFLQVLFYYFYRGLKPFYSIYFFGEH